MIENNFQASHHSKISTSILVEYTFKYSILYEFMHYIISDNVKKWRLYKLDDISLIMHKSLSCTEDFQNFDQSTDVDYGVFKLS